MRRKTASGQLCAHYLLAENMACLIIAHDKAASTECAELGYASRDAA